MHGNEPEEKKSTRKEKASSAHGNDRETAAPFASLVRPLLDWYDRHGRALPFRFNRTPYRVLLAEFMLQQTQTAAMQPYFDRFLERWPTPQLLAKASEAEILAEWAGLGYYRRAANLKQTIDKIVGEMEGQVPSDPNELIKLPGIGAYTAGAIASIAFGQKTAAVDGNLVRVVSRLNRLNVTAGETKTFAIVRDYVEAGLPDDRPGDVNEALMDLSASICRPKNPRCQACPLNEHCLAFRWGDPERFPLKKAKKASPTEKLTYIVLSDRQRVLLTTRNESLLKDTCEFIRVDGHLKKKDVESFVRILLDDEQAPPAKQSGEAEKKKSGRKIKVKDTLTIKHVFSHRIWDIRCFLVLTDKLPEQAAIDAGALLARQTQPDHSDVFVSDGDGVPTQEKSTTSFPKRKKDDAKEEKPRLYGSAAVENLTELPFSALFRPVLQQLETLKAEKQVPSE